jgi:outer membrane protein OmpA-like peptidoglycan-associated protein
MNVASKWHGRHSSTGHNLFLRQCNTIGSNSSPARNVPAQAALTDWREPEAAPLVRCRPEFNQLIQTTQKEVSMPMRVFLAVLLGLSFLIPAGTAAPADPRNSDALQRVAQATPKDDEEELRQKAKRDRNEAKAKREAKGKAKDAAEKPEPAGKPKDEAEKSESTAKPKAATEKSEPAVKPKAVEETKTKPEQGTAAKAAPAKAEPKQRTEDELRTGGRPAEPPAKPKAAEETKSQPERRKAAEEEKPKTIQPQQRQSDDRDRNGSRRDGDRARRGDDEQRSRERATKRETEKTPAQELTKTEISESKPVTIDGGARELRREGNRVVIRSNDFDRLRGSRGDQRVERLSNGQTRTIVVYPDGTQVITVVGSRGEIIHRSRRERGGREIILVREVRREPMAQINLGPLRLTIPREQYIVDSRRASRREMHDTLFAPPVERVERVYSLEEVRRFDRVRDKMRRIDINTITFDTDSALITPDQARALEELAAVINDLIDRNPQELVLIEGHTDLVGSEVYNLALSDRRAEAVAVALTDYFDVPPENLVTQGYGEAYPKVPTEAAERENRRVAVRRITPLVGSAQN